MSHDRAIFLHTPELDSGGYPEACPFDTSRAGRALETARSMGLMDGDDRELVAPTGLDRDALATFHTSEYLDALMDAGRGTLAPERALAAGLGTPDCPIFTGVYEYCSLAASGTVTGARSILIGDADIAFNPSGGFHHAQPGNAAGFCYLNDIALAALVLVAAGKRVLFLDIDVHHCDGVQDAFFARRDVMTVSLHESGKTLFPGTGFESEIGEGEGTGYSVNIPLPVGTYDAVYMRAFREAALPVMRAYDPDVVIVELGMDALTGDPLAHLHLSNNVHADVLSETLALGKAVLATGGGGYNVENTVRGWALCWSVLCGDDVPDDLGIGMGGVMLANTDWLGGLRDRVLLSDAGRRGEIDGEVTRVIDAIKSTIFPVHGL